MYLNYTAVDAKLAKSLQLDCILYCTLKIAGLFQPKFGLNMDGQMEPLGLNPWFGFVHI